MLTTNINIADRLINGQMGTVLKIHVNKVTPKPTVIYVNLMMTAGSTFIKTTSYKFATMALFLLSQ